MPLAGLARTPRKIAERLSAAATSVALAAAELSALGRGDRDPRAVEEAAIDAQRLSHDAALGAAEMFGGGIDRSDVLAIALSMKAAAGSIDDAAAALRHVAPEAAPWDAVTGVARDLARELVGAIDRLDGPRHERDARLDRAEALFDEGRALLRRTRAQLLSRGTDVRVAVTGEEALRRLERVIRALVRSARAVRQVAIKHA